MSAQATALFEDSVIALEPLVGPPLLPIEVTNAVRKRVRRSQLSPSQGTAHLDRFLSLGVAILPDGGEQQRAHHHRALAVAIEFDLPAAYDAHYIALAETLDCDLWTDDRRLLRQLNGRLSFVRWIGDYAQTA